MRWVGKGTRSTELSPDCPKERATCEEVELCFAEATSRSDSYWVPATSGEPVAAGLGLLESVETVIEYQNWEIAAVMIAAQVLPSWAPSVFCPKIVSLKARCHAAVFSTSPGGSRPACICPANPRVPTPELGPHSDLISHGRLLPGLVTVLVGPDCCFLKQQWLPLSHCQQKDWKSGGNWRGILIEMGKNEVWSS